MNTHDLDDARIMETLILYESGDETCWTDETICQLSGLESDRADASLGRHEKQGHITRDRGAYRIEDAGRIYYESIRRQPEVVANSRSWKNEVLTGITSNGERSKIDWAVLPRTTSSHKGGDPERSVIQLDAITKAKKIASAKLKMPIEELERRIDDGSVRLCTGRNQVLPHLGRFHRSGKTPKGSPRWRAICIDCEKKFNTERSGSKKDSGN
jgi:hypothetical protein